MINYRKNIKDHLGNSRLMFSDLDENGVVAESEILQVEAYYPFGLGHEGLGNAQVGVENAYLYNGKELNGDFGLDWNDYGARWYMADIGRWGAVDPLAEKYVGMSPYNYVGGNPVMNIDPDGRSFFSSNFLNRNGGHWLDEIGMTSSSDRADADHEGKNEHNSIMPSNLVTAYSNAFENLADNNADRIIGQISTGDSDFYDMLSGNYKIPNLKYLKSAGAKNNNYFHDSVLCIDGQEVTAKSVLFVSTPNNSISGIEYPDQGIANRYFSITGTVYIVRGVIGRGKIKLNSHASMNLQGPERVFKGYISFSKDQQEKLQRILNQRTERLVWEYVHSIKSPTRRESMIKYVNENHVRLFGFKKTN